MTLEELQAEAKRQGYGLHKLQPYVPLLKCPQCGSRPWKKVSKLTNKPMYKCKCMDTGWCKGDRYARLKWNEMVERMKS